MVLSRIVYDFSIMFYDLQAHRVFVRSHRVFVRSQYAGFSYVIHSWLLGD